MSKQSHLQGHNKPQWRYWLCLNAWLFGTNLKLERLGRLGKGSGTDLPPIL